MLDSGVQMVLMARIKKLSVVSKRLTVSMLRLLTGISAFLNSTFLVRSPSSPPPLPQENISLDYLATVVANESYCVGPQTEKGHPAHGHR